MAILLHSSRIILGAVLLALCIQSAYSHTYLSSVFLDNRLLPEGDCVRPHPEVAYDSPIPLVTSPDMTCGWLPKANNPANRKCPIAAGSTIGLQWHHQSNDPSDDIVDPTHVGPIIVYLAKSESGAGNVWFKIFEDGYANGRWGVDRMLDKRGRVDIKLPSDIAPGNYLLRGEILALHGAYALNGVQPYVGCVELTISGDGTAKPPGVAFPGFYKNTDPGMLFSRYQNFVTYPVPGPALYKSGSSSSSSSSSSGSPTSAPSSAPTSSPTYAPPSVSPTTRPSTSSSSGSSTTGSPATVSPATGSIRVGLAGGTNEWWVEVMVNGGGETTVKVEMMDSGAITSWVALADMGYAYVLDSRSLVKAPISLRLTSSTNKQVVLTNVFTSLSTGGKLIDSYKSYTNTAPTQAPTSAPTTKPTSAPTQAPTSAPTTKPTLPPTQAPTQAPTSKPTSPPTIPPSNGGSKAKVTVYSSASVWWLALTTSGDADKVEIKDSGRVTSWSAMEENNWGNNVVYTFSPQGSQLVAPITVRITSAAGKTVTATIDSITPNKVYEADGSL